MYSSVKVIYTVIHWHNVQWYGTTYLILAHSNETASNHTHRQRNFTQKLLLRGDPVPGFHAGFFCYRRLAVPLMYEFINFPYRRLVLSTGPGTRRDLIGSTQRPLGGRGAVTLYPVEPAPAAPRTARWLGHVHWVASGRDPRPHRIGPRSVRGWAGSGDDIFCSNVGVCAQNASCMQHIVVPC